MAVVAEKKGLPHTVSCQLARPAGIEQEGFLTNKKGVPLYVRELLDEANFRPDGFRTSTAEVGRDQIEFITNPSDDVGDLYHDLFFVSKQVLTLNGGDVQVHFLPRRPWPLGLEFGTSGFVTPRHKAILRALAHPDEGGSDSVLVHEMRDICATHYHFGFADVRSQEAVNACNILNAAAPQILAWAHQRYKVPPADRTRVWTRYARQERLPAPRWFRDFAAYKAYFESIPALVKGSNKEAGEWEVDLQNPQVFGDPAAEGTTWWGTRLRACYNTVEFRWMFALPNFEAVIECLIEIDRYLEASLEHIGDQRFGSFDEAMAKGAVKPYLGMATVRDEFEWRREMNRF